MAEPEAQTEVSGPGQIPTREALEIEFHEAQEQVKKLEKILALPDSTIELFLGTERYL